MSAHTSLTHPFMIWMDSLFKDHAILRLWWRNFHPVIKGKVYRANHPTPHRLSWFVEHYHIKTLINLRGKRHCGSDILSRTRAKDLGIQHIDMAFESRNAPQKERILRFYDIYCTASYPALMHCKSGADRTGLAAAMVILFEGGTMARARQELTWRYLHFPWKRTGILDAFLDLYMQQTGGRKKFIDWVRDDYKERDVKRR